MEGNGHTVWRWQIAMQDSLHWHLACTRRAGMFPVWVQRMFICRTAASFLSAILFVAGFASPASPARKTGSERFMASAYSIGGKAASGSKSYKGTVSADPKVLPLGSKIRVRNAGIYSGEYTVVDTGRRVKGHLIDIDVSSVREAREFGKRQVEVEILESLAHR